MVGKGLSLQLFFKTPSDKVILSVDWPTLNAPPKILQQTTYSNFTASLAYHIM